MDINNNDAKKVKNNDPYARVKYTTQYGNVTIANEFTLEHGFIRTLVIDGGHESATYIDNAKHFELVYGYTNYYNLMFDGNININDVLMIGGAGYSYPKYYISHFENNTMDVAEIDKDITNLAKEYFYLDELIDKYDLVNNKRLNIFDIDGRIYLDNAKKKYDAILNDAFLGKHPAKSLITLEAAYKIYDHLNENGKYLTNIISPIEGKGSLFLKSIIKTLKKVFKNVYVFPCYYKRLKEISQNNMVIATDDDIEFNENVNVNYLKGLVLTDDDCPIEKLI